MKLNRSLRLASSLSAGVAALLMAAAGPAAAQSHHQRGAMSHAAADVRSSDNRGGCVGGGTWQDRKTCLKEAAAAKQAAQRHRLATGQNEEDFMKNRLMRCQSLPAADRETCRARVSHPTEVTGSVTGGGMLYEYSETVPLAPTSDNGAMAAPRPSDERMQPRPMQPRRAMPPRPMPPQPRMN